MEQHEPQKKQGDKLAPADSPETTDAGDRSPAGPTGAPTELDEPVKQGPSGPPPKAVHGDDFGEPDRGH